MGFESPLFFYAALVGLPLFILSVEVWLHSPVKRSFSIVYDSTAIAFIVRRMLLRHVLMGIVVIGILLALSSPYVAIGKGTSSSSASDIVLLVDDSFSMGGRRLQSARTIARDITEEFPQANIAICELTSKVFCRAPLGSSWYIVSNAIDAIAVDAITGSGSRITQALNSMPREFDLAEEKDRVIVLLSDGGDLFTSTYWWDELDGVLTNLSNQRIHVVSIGVGGLEPIPLAIDARGEKIFSALNEEKMRRIANLTDGIYIHESDIEKNGLSFLSEFLIYAEVLSPATINISWIPAIFALTALWLYMFFFWKNP